MGDESRRSGEGRGRSRSRSRSRSTTTTTASHIVVPVLVVPSREPTDPELREMLTISESIRRTLEQRTASRSRPTSTTTTTAPLIAFPSREATDRELFTISESIRRTVEQRTASRNRSTSTTATTVPVTQASEPLLRIFVEDNPYYASLLVPVEQFPVAAAPVEQFPDDYAPVEQFPDAAAPVEQLSRITISEEHIKDKNSITSTCSICHENFKLGEEEVSQMHCRHIYHTSCISTWLRSKNTCPLCRRQSQRQ